MPLDRYIHTILFVLLGDLNWTSSYKPAITCIGLFYPYNNVCLNLIYSCMSYTSGNLKARDACRRARVCVFGIRGCSAPRIGLQGPNHRRVQNMQSLIDVRGSPLICTQPPPPPPPPSSLHSLSTIQPHHIDKGYTKGRGGWFRASCGHDECQWRLYIVANLMANASSCCCCCWMNEWMNLCSGSTQTQHYVCVYIPMLCMYGFHDNDISLYVKVVRICRSWYTHKGC